MNYVLTDLGIHTADAEQVRITYDNDLLLSFVDWSGEPKAFRLRDVLAFRWQELDDAAVPRDDSTYEVVESQWLMRQAKLRDEEPREFAHYVMCFNSCGVLDVLCRRFVQAEPMATLGAELT